MIALYPNQNSHVVTTKKALLHNKSQKFLASHAEGQLPPGKLFIISGIVLSALKRTREVACLTYLL